MPRDPRPPQTTLTVEATATIDGQHVWLQVGVGRVLHTPAGKKLRMKLGAIPDDREIWVSLSEVLDLDLQDHPEEAALAVEPTPHILH